MDCKTRWASIGIPSVILALLILSGVALARDIFCKADCRGTKYADTIIGNNANNFVEGLPGEDFIDGNVGNDRLFGNRDVDEIHGSRGEDYVEGGKHMEVNYLYGETGNDTINAVDEFPPGATDYIYCGKGTDIAYVDGWTEARPDVHSGCEQVIPAVCLDVYPADYCVYPWPE